MKNLLILTLIIFTFFISFFRAELSRAELSRAEDARVVSKEEIACKQKGGRWEGSISGRGRLHGCNMPTHDAGKACHSADDCESVCLTDEVCSGWTMYKGCGFFKGYKTAMCFE
jgi:hypothetical protein